VAAAEGSGSVRRPTHSVTANQHLDITTTLGPADHGPSGVSRQPVPRAAAPSPVGAAPRRLGTPPRSVSAEARPRPTPSRREPRSPQRGSSHVVSGLSIENLDAGRNTRGPLRGQRGEAAERSAWRPWSERVQQRRGACGGARRGAPTKKPKSRPCGSSLPWPPPRRGSRASAMTETALGRVVDKPRRSWNGRGSRWRQRWNAAGPGGTGGPSFIKYTT